jgi:hypothetical protein
MFCVDSHGRSRGKIVLAGIVTREVAERLVWGKLDAVDPVVVLRLVPDEPKVTAATLLASMGALIRPLRPRPFVDSRPHR